MMELIVVFAGIVLGIVILLMLSTGLENSALTAWLKHIDKK